MNYIWSKKSLLEFLNESINKVVWNWKYKFSDLFAWTWIVWRYFKSKWHPIIANDLQYYSYVLNKNYIENNKILEFKGLEKDIPEIKNISSKSWLRTKKILEYLNKLNWIEWFIYKNYSEGWTKNQEFVRLYFTDRNAKRTDAIRQKIEKWKNKNKITENEYFFLLASLIEAIDKVANTASVYGAFLKKIKKSAEKDLILEEAKFDLDNLEHKVYNKDINKLVLEIENEVVYLDPPYNHRQYGWNYHLLETIAKYDNPKIRGKTGTRVDPDKKSTYCSKVEVKKSFEDLITNIKADYIFLSYNDEWIMSLDEIKEIMSKRWKYGVFKKEYRRFKADKTENRNHKKTSVIEYLHYVKVNKENN